MGIRLQAAPALQERECLPEGGLEMAKDRQECRGQLGLVCESCDGRRTLFCDDEGLIACDDCGGSGIDPDALYTQVVVRGFWREARWEGEVPTGLLPDFSPWSTPPSASPAE